MSNQFSALGESLAGYFRAYGGWKAVLTSPIFWLGILVTLLSYHRWQNEGWVDLTLTLIPGLLGFSLGTYSILFSIITARMRKTMADLKVPSGDSYLDVVNATFFHFIFVQLLAMMWAIVYDSHAGIDLIKLMSDHSQPAISIYAAAKSAGSFIGFFLLIYSFLLTLSAALAVYGLASLKAPAEK